MADTVYRIASRGAVKPGNGGTGALSVTLDALAKPHDPLTAPYQLANENICAEIGRAIRLPIPQSEIVRFETSPTKYFATLNFNPGGNSLPPVDPDECLAALPDLCAGLLLFDILIANLDRHHKNLTVDYSIRPAAMRIFDHGHALFGYKAGQGEARLQRLWDDLGVSWSNNSPHGSGSGSHRHCLLEKISTDDYFEKWIGRIKTIPDFLIDEVCAAAVDLGITTHEAQCAVQFLRHRRDHLGEIIHAHSTKFKSVTTWSLFTGQS